MLTCVDSSMDGLIVIDNEAQIHTWDGKILKGRKEDTANSI